MTNDTAHRVQEVFEEVMSCSPADRLRILDEQCGDDVDLRAEVESLLKHDTEAPDDFMRPQDCRRSDLAHASSDTPDQRIDATIGQYEIREVIATGGMGTVYLAQQIFLKHEVALKVVLAGQRLALPFAALNTKPKSLADSNMITSHRTGLRCRFVYLRLGRLLL